METPKPLSNPDPEKMVPVGNVKPAVDPQVETQQQEQPSTQGKTFIINSLPCKTP